MNDLQLAAEMFNAEGQNEKHTNNMTKLIVATHNFANAPKNDKILRLKKIHQF